MIVFIFRERGREGGREGEKNQCVVASHASSWGLGPQPRHVPRLEIKPATFGSQASTQSTETYQLGLTIKIIDDNVLCITLRDL